MFMLVYAVFPYLELDMINKDVLLLYQSAYCVIEELSCIFTIMTVILFLHYASIIIFMENHNPLHSQIAEIHVHEEAYNRSDPLLLAPSCLLAMFIIMSIAMEVLLLVSHNDDLYIIYILRFDFYFL
ncbi:hypothetical protein ACJX0J_034895, partial [Zea mays]